MLSSNSFLPSGAVEYLSKDPSSRSSTAISPLSVPRRFPNNSFMSPHINNHSAQGKPLSPPQSRSPSAENASAAMLEDWRTYTANLRSQYQGERAHMMADRGRMEECMDEERQLWELERSYFVAQVAELEAKLEKSRQRAESLERRLQGPTSQPMSTSTSSSGAQKASHGFGIRSSSGGSHDSSSNNYVPQESGRDADGSPFYAPAPRNPSRTFGDTEASNLKIDSITSGSDSLIQVTNKELKPSDFLQTTPGSEILDPIPEIPASIDISFIQPGLEGVSIKASAVNPTFAAKILSPVSSPDKAPARPESTSLNESTNQRPSLSRSPSSAEDRAKKTLEVVSAPENRRLTMNAGHTPSHSLTKLTWLKDPEDGDATPRQAIIHKGAIDRRASMALSLVSVNDEDEEVGDENEDKELAGPLGLTNEPIVDNPFLAALTEKLEIVQRSQPVSPSEDGAASTIDSATKGNDEEEDADEGSVLRLKIKPSMNFGRPMGSM